MTYRVNKKTLNLNPNPSPNMQTTSSIPEVTLDDLVGKLRNVRCEMTERRLFKSVTMNGIWGSDSDSDSDDPELRRRRMKKSSKIAKSAQKNDNIEKDRNTVFGTLAYFNSNLCIGIQNLTPTHLLENNVSNILFDLANMPLPMVLDRLKMEGAKVEN